jgi:mRNA-degrading endonuclease RelE of RelBE toxin-antitoxin system
MKREPFGGDIRDLGDGTYRRRVGAYRIRFEVDWDTRTVSVLWVRRRTSTTY